MRTWPTCAADKVQVRLKIYNNPFDFRSYQLQIIIVSTDYTADQVPKHAILTECLLCKVTDAAEYGHALDHLQSEQFLESVWSVCMSHLQKLT